MTQDEMIELARQAGGIDMTNTLAGNFTAWIGTGTPEFLERFAKLVAEKEREACAKEADKRLYDFTMLTSNPPQNGSAWSIASAIRARGEKT
jgi:hypothetical protein